MIQMVFTFVCDFCGNTTGRDDPVLCTGFGYTLPSPYMPSGWRHMPNGQVICGDHRVFVTHERGNNEFFTQSHPADAEALHEETERR